MLEKAGVLTAQETQRLVAVLEELKAEAERGEFVIRREEEDCHSALEGRLIAKLGDLGKKIHTARSRNDQVAVALRLYVKDRLDGVAGLVDAFVAALRQSRPTPTGRSGSPVTATCARPCPRRSHFGWERFVESMQDNKKMLKAVRSLIDQNPLGSGAGYGIPVFELDPRAERE